MPSTYAHYRMGQEVLKQLSGPVRDIIMENKELYGFLPWYDRDQPCFTINRASKYRSGSDFVVFYIGYDRI